MKRAKGSKEYKDFLEKKKLTPRQAIRAKCYDCMGFYVDGVQDCGIETCPLYLYHAYRNKSQRVKEDLDSE